MGRTSDARERLMEAVTELFWTLSYDSTTIDQICERAGVRKGSFYHFFESKADLAAAALDAEWERYRPKLDAIFSPTRPPLDRIRAICEFQIEEQLELKARFGCVLGCPLCTLGAEISTQDRRLQTRIRALLDHGERYLESTLRDAHAAGLIHAPDARTKARFIHAYHLGLLTQARIYDDPTLLREMTPGTFEILGLTRPDPAPAS